MRKKRSGQIKNNKTHLQSPLNLEELKKILEVNTLPGTSEAQEALLQWAQKKVQKEKQGGLMWLRENKNDLLAQLCVWVRPKPEETGTCYLSTEGRAKRARVDGFIQLGYLPEIFAHDQRYSAILPRLWNFYECDQVSAIRHLNSEYERWLWIVQRWVNMSAGLWKYRSPISHLKVYDSETKELKKERHGGRSDSDIVMLEDLKKYMENISKNLDIDFPLPSLLFSEAQEEKRITDGADKATSFTHSPDFCSITKDGETFTLTAKQGKVIQILLDA